MKVAVSIPDDVFRDAEREAKRLGISRSELVARALRQLLETHRGAQITASYDRAFGENSRASSDEAVLEANRRALLAVEW